METIKRCSKCGERKAVSGFYRDSKIKSGLNSMCKACWASYSKAWRTRNNYNRRQVELDRQRKLRDPAKFLAYHREKQRASRERVRAAVIAGYGGICACCGEDEPKFLAIDHRYNDGAKARRNGEYTVTLYRRLIKEGFPTDRYQLLCHNCNSAKGYYGGCPHESGQCLRLVI